MGSFVAKYMTGILFLVQFNNFDRPDYGFLLELHILTLATRSYALLRNTLVPRPCAAFHCLQYWSKGALTAKGSLISS